MMELETLINFFGYNFHQLAEVHRDMHGLEQNPFLLPIQLMQFLDIRPIINTDIKNASFHFRVIPNTAKTEMLKQLAVRILYRNNNPFDLQRNLE